jgi:hypothetical protein
MPRDARRTCSSGKFFSKNVSLVDASKKSKDDACALMFTASSMLASAHACASPAGALFADTLWSIEHTVEDAIPPNADRPMSTCGMRWPVTLLTRRPL